MKKKLNSLAIKSALIFELISFFWSKKLWWLIPMILTLLLFGAIAVFVQSAPIAPFIYPLF